MTVERGLLERYVEGRVPEIGEWVELTPVPLGENWLLRELLNSKAMEQALDEDLAKVSR